MPELPEVETVRRGIAPLLLGRTIVGVSVRDGRLRLPVTDDLARCLQGETVTAVTRRAKYLLVHGQRGGLLIHLGMTGVLRVVPSTVAAGRHDHVDLLLDDGQLLRFSDPRRFGLLLWTEGEPQDHPLLQALGPEPLATEFDADYLYERTRGRRQAIKTLIMDQRLVVGVGNIYASEALFEAGINPVRPAGDLTRVQCRKLVAAIRAILSAAISAGGTTLRDFRQADGAPGYFSIDLRVYGRAGEPCQRCRRPLHNLRIGQRSSFFCPHCQR